MTTCEHSWEEKETVQSNYKGQRYEAVRFGCGRCGATKLGKAELVGKAGGRRPMWKIEVVAETAPVVVSDAVVAMIAGTIPWPEGTWIVDGFAVPVCSMSGMPEVACECWHEQNDFYSVYEIADAWAAVERDIEQIAAARGWERVAPVGTRSWRQ